MSNLLFYHPNLEQDTFHLSEEESKHLVRVLRKKKGDEIRLMDGKGMEAIGMIENELTKQVEIFIKERKQHSLNNKYHFHLAIAPTKNADRMEWMLEKCAEIGIQEITLLTCSNSERSQMKTDRLKKILLSAIKQSKQFHLPSLNEQVNFSKFIEQKWSPNTLKLIAWCESEKKQNLKQILGRVQQQDAQEIIVLIGPEGDFSPAEVNLAIDQKFEPISLGENILRTETAGVFVCSVLANHFL
jgi:16S rRNA (uracil1498-N3)-methyltransferase